MSIRGLAEGWRSIKRKNMTNLELAKHIIITYLQRCNTVKGASEVLLIQLDNKILKEHIKALKNIFENALKELEKGEYLDE